MTVAVATSASALTYRQKQLVALFVFLARRAGAGGTRRDIAAVLGMSHTCPRLRELVDTLTRWRIVTATRAVGEARAPYRYYALPIAWQNGKGIVLDPTAVCCPGEAS